MPMAPTRVEDERPLTGSLDPDGSVRLGERTEAQELTLLDLYLPLAQNRRLIGKVTGIFALVALVVSLLMPNQYKAVTKILPPQQPQSSLSSMMGQLGALAGLSAGRDMLGLKNPADLYVAILKSRTIADVLIDQFDLKSFFKVKTMADARLALEDCTNVEASKDGIISISYEDKDPKKAAAIANAY